SRSDDQSPEFNPFSLGVLPESLFAVLPESNIGNIDGWFNDPGDPLYNGGAYDGPWTREMGIDNGLAETLGVGVGDTVQVQVNGDWVDFTVAFILHMEFGGEVTEGLFISFFHLSELQIMTGFGLRPDTGEQIDAVDVITVVVTPEYKKNRSRFLSLQEAIQENFTNYEVSSKDELVSEMAIQTAMAEAFALAIGGIAFLIGLLFVTASMAITVDERRGEIGMLRAIGFSVRTIFSMVFFESLILVILGTLGGIGAGYLFQGFLSDYLERSFGVIMDLSIFRSDVLLQYFILVLVMGSLASLYPAWKACRSRVVEALREVER
ncbi:MAG: ABC transporter permease, partial [Thermoplasmata archaeon]|nr:ABC transporter permease [Thermoplasmata archaeon]